MYFSQGEYKFFNHIIVIALYSDLEPSIIHEELNAMSVEQRTQMWNNNRMSKIENLREMKKDKGIEECTFKPQIGFSKGKIIL